VGPSTSLVCSLICRKKWFFFGESFIPFSDRSSYRDITAPNSDRYDTVRILSMQLRCTSKIQKYARDDNTQILRPANFSTIPKCALGSYSTREQKHLPCFHFSPLPFSPTGSFFFFGVGKYVVLVGGIVGAYPVAIGKVSTDRRFCNLLTDLHSLAGSLPVRVLEYSSTNDRALRF